jgi:hypothetical protein
VHEAGAVVEFAPPGLAAAAGELNGNLVDGGMCRNRYLRVSGHGLNARLELSICRGRMQRLLAFPVGDIDQLEPTLRRQGAVQPSRG